MYMYTYVYVYVCVCVCMHVHHSISDSSILPFSFPTSFIGHFPTFASPSITLHHTLHHTLQHTIQHILQHTLQHTLQHVLQHVLQHIPTSYTTTPLLFKTLSLPLATPTLATGWRRPIGCLKLQVIFCK